MKTEIVKGSLSAIAQQSGKSIAESFVNADALVIMDTSGSMAGCDSRGGRSRYDVACEELERLQEILPGKIAVIAFSDEVIFCPSGKPLFLGSGTDVAGALKFAKIADLEGMKFFLISDGASNDAQAALKVARTFQNEIKAIYVGPEGGSGAKFLQELAWATGGEASLISPQAMQLEAQITQLLSSKN